MPRATTSPLVPAVSPRPRHLARAAAITIALLCAGAVAVVASSLLAPRAVGRMHQRAHAPDQTQPVPSAPVTAPTAPAAASTATAAASTATAVERRIDRASVDALLSADAHPGARIVPAMRDGQPVGFKLYAIRPGSLPAAIGLENGDTLHRVNGHELSSPERALTAYHELRGADRFELELTRSGEPLRLLVAVE
jgi:hypothetical protein